MGSRWKSLVPCVIAALLAASCGSGSGASSKPGPTGSSNPPSSGSSATGITAVNHVVIVIQENRSFDHYFGQMTAYRKANSIPINGSPATIDDLSSGTFSNFSPATGGNIAPYHTGSVCTEDLSPDWTESHKNFNWENPAGAGPSSPMDGFAQLAVQISQYA